MNIEKKISTNYRTNGTFPFVQLFCSFFFVFCLRVVAGFFIFHSSCDVVWNHRCLNRCFIRIRSFVIRIAFLWIVYCIYYMACVCVCVRCYLRRYKLAVLCCCLSVCVSSILVEYVYVET